MVRARPKTGSLRVHTWRNLVASAIGRPSSKRSIRTRPGPGLRRSQRPLLRQSPAGKEALTTGHQFVLRSRATSRTQGLIITSFEGVALGLEYNGPTATFTSRSRAARAGLSCPWWRSVRPPSLRLAASPRPWADQACPSRPRLRAGMAYMRAAHTASILTVEERRFGDPAHSRLGPVALRSQGDVGYVLECRPYTDPGATMKRDHRCALRVHDS